MSDSVRPHRQPTRLPRPWDSPGRNTGVGCPFLLQCTKVKNESEVAQLCPTLSDPTDSSPPGSPVPGILQARTLEWVAVSFSSAWTWKVKAKSLSRVRCSATPWTAALQARSRATNFVKLQDSKSITQIKSVCIYSNENLEKIICNIIKNMDYIGENLLKDI